MCMDSIAIPSPNLGGHLFEIPPEQCRRVIDKAKVIFPDLHAAKMTLAEAEERNVGNVGNVLILRYSERQ
jgi:hypothetical protein